MTSVDGDFQVIAIIAGSQTPLVVPNQEGDGHR
jgi:hypothetical protein